MLALALTGCTTARPDAGSAPTPVPPSHSAVTSSLPPTPGPTASDGWPADQRPLPGLQGTAINDWLSAQWGLSPGRTGRATRHDASTGTDLDVRTQSDTSDHLRILACDATRSAFGRQFLSDCVSKAIPGPDQSVAMSWMSSELAGWSPPPQDGQQQADHRVGVYYLSMAQNSAGYGITISARSS
jgi:hypothetical protein